MKKTVLIVTILLTTLFSNIVFAQGKNEFKLSYGYSGLDFSETFQLMPEYSPKDHTKGTLAISYNRRINDRISVGAQVNYTLIKDRFTNDEKRYIYEGSENPNHYMYERNSALKHIIYPLAKFDYRYINKPSFEMYSSAMIGLMSIDEGFPFHITGLGFRHGKQHAVFYEFGFGFGHLVSLGYSVKI